MARASRGFCSRMAGAAVASAFGFIRAFLIVVHAQDEAVSLAFRKVFFIKYGFGNYVFLTGPIAYVPIPAPLAAKREIRVDSGVRIRLADGAFVLHAEKSIAQPSTRRGAPVAMR